MRIRSLALTLMSTLGLAAMLASGILLSEDWNRLNDLDEGRTLVETLAPTIKFVESLALEREIYNQALMSDGAHRVNARRELDERETDADLLFDWAHSASERLPPPLRGEFVDHIIRAKAIVLSARAEVSPYLDAAEPSPEPAARLVNYYAVADEEIDQALGVAERRLAEFDPALGMLLEMSRFANDIREQAGLISTLLTRYVNSRTPFTIPERIQNSEATGAIRITWRRLQNLADELGDASVTAGVGHVRSQFFALGEPIYKAMTDAGRTGAPPPMDLAAWRAWEGQRLNDALAARDPPLKQAAERIERMRRDAYRVAILGSAALAALLAFLIGGAYLLERRVLRPIGALTGVLDAFSQADRVDAELAVKGRRLAARFARRADEIGLLARALQRLCAHADDLRTLNARFDTLIDHLPEGVSLYDGSDSLIVANRRFGELYGLTDVASLVGLSFAAVAELGDRLGASGKPNPEERLRLALGAEHDETDANCIAELANGRVLRVNGVRMPGGGWLSTHLDITERRRAEEQIAFLANHDPLTSLANRSQLARDLEAAVERAHAGEPFAVMCVDLDHFKLVNDTLGHVAGDELLRQFAERLRDVAPAAYSIARLGGDEFALLVNSNGVDLNDFAERIIAAVSEPYQLDGQHAEISASIGVAQCPTDGATPRDLLCAADLAMYRAKQDGRRGYYFFRPEMDVELQLRRALEIDMRAAIAYEQFELAYQPIVDLDGNAIVAFEALLRWNHPTRGRVSPADFIPLAEDSGLIGELGVWALRRACAEATRWPRDVKVSVNLSPRQFNSGRLFADIVGALADFGLPPDRLQLEITERVMLVNTEATLAILHQLRLLGVAIAMDDFGAGYSSLSYLRRFPFDKIKIDQAFVRDITREPDSVSIVRAIADLARALRMSTTAEGVETEEQFQLVRTEGCTEIQGHYISCPLEASAIPDLLRAHNLKRQAA